LDSGGTPGARPRMGARGSRGRRYSTIRRRIVLLDLPEDRGCMPATADDVDLPILHDGDSEMGPRGGHAGSDRPDISLGVVLQHCPDVVPLRVVAFTNDVDAPIIGAHGPETGLERIRQAGGSGPGIRQWIVRLY